MTSTDIVTGEGITMTDPNPREPKHISEHVTEALAQMTAPDGPYKWGPSSVPCPPWCSLPSGHSYESIDREGWLYRYHSPAQDEIGTPDVWVSVEERMRPGQNGPEVEISHVSVHAADEDMPVEKARALSAAIARAADLAEEPGGLSVTPAADGRAQLVWIVDDRGDLIVDVDTTMLGPGVFISDRVEQVAVSNVELLDELIRGLQKARRVLVKSAS
jgi:hypothetical protein